MKQIADEQKNPQNKNSIPNRSGQQRMKPGAGGNRSMSPRGRTPNQKDRYVSTGSAMRNQSTTPGHNRGKSNQAG